MRTVFITRKNLSKDDSFFVMLDGSTIGKMNDQEYYSFEVDDDAHEIGTYSPKGYGDVYALDEGSNDVILDTSLNPLTGAYDLTFSWDKSPLNPKHETHQKDNSNSAVKEGSPTGSIISAIIIGLIACGLCFFIYAIGQTSLIGMLVGMACAIAGSACMIIGGHWILIIPLPYVFIWKVGCVRKNQPKGRKILTAVLALVLPLIGILMLFLLMGL